MIGNGIRASKIQAWGTEKSIVITYLRSFKKSKWTNCYSDTLKGARWQLWICFQTLFLPEKALAPHSSALAWKIPWTEEPGGLQSMGLLRVRRD